MRLGSGQIYDRAQVYFMLNFFFSSSSFDFRYFRYNFFFIISFEKSREMFYKNDSYRENAKHLSNQSKIHFYIETKRNVFLKNFIWFMPKCAIKHAVTILYSVFVEFTKKMAENKTRFLRAFR